MTEHGSTRRGRLATRTRARLARALGSRRRRRVAAAVAVAVVAGAAVGIADPFAGPGGRANSLDNQYPTSTQRVTRQDLSSQTQVGATLGYSGSYSIALPTGTSAATMAADRATVQADDAKVAADTDALDRARSASAAQDAATLLGALATQRADATALAGAKAQLATDERLGCPASSPATVTTATGTGSGNAANNGNAGSGTNPGSGSSQPPSTSTTAKLRRVVPAASQVVASSVPVVATGDATVTASGSVSLSGTVDPNGSDTSYAFEYGTTAALGRSTVATSAGAGTTAVAVTASLSGLSPGATYDFALVATNAAGTATGATQTFQLPQSSCAAQAIVVGGDTEALAVAKDAVVADRASSGATVAQDEQTLAGDESALTAAQHTLASDSAQVVDPGARVTELPVAGQVVRRGQSVYSLDGGGVPLLYGPVTPYRALSAGVGDGADVAELQRNLVALGFGHGLVADGHFGASTTAAVEAWQRSIGAPVTGIVALGDDVVEPGPIEIATVAATDGVAATAGLALMTATSTTLVVTIDLDAALQSQVKVGDPVTITLPDNSTTPGVVTSVGTIATVPSNSQNGGSSSPTVTVLVTPTRLTATAGLDQAPVNVSITTQRVSNVLVVPVDALLALAGGGYAVEVDSHGVHHLVAVSLGLFDDAAGLVQVSGSGLQAGERVVVPGT